MHVQKSKRGNSNDRLLGGQGQAGTVRRTLEKEQKQEEIGRILYSPVDASRGFACLIT